jgi:hypothetical protein
VREKKIKRVKEKKEEAKIQSKELAICSILKKRVYFTFTTT